MPIKFDCPTCAKKLSVSEALAGKRGKCPGCQNPLVVPRVSKETGQTQKGTSPPPPPSRPQSRPTSTNGSGTHPPVSGPPEIDAEAEAAAALADPARGEATIIEFECNFCSSPITLPVAEAGKRVPCPECSRIIKVPEPVRAQKDWRQSDIPSGARQAGQQQLPDSSYAGTTTSRVSREALEEADALPTYRRPTTVAEQILRYVTLTALVALLGWGGMAGYRWWTGLSEAAALKAALSYAGKSDGILSPVQAAALHLGASQYYRARDAHEAARQSSSGYGILTADRQSSTERDLLLIELAQVPIELASANKEEIDANRRISWEEAQKHATAALKAISSQEARLEGLAQVAALLKQQGESRRAIPLALRALDQPADQTEALGQIGLQLMSLGDTSEGIKACQQALAAYDGKNPPKITATILAVADLLKKPQPKFDKNSVNDDTINLGKVEGLARTGDLDTARKEIENLALPAIHLQGLNTIIEIGLDQKKANPADVEAALKYAESNRVRGQAPARWQLYRLIQLARRAGIPPDRLVDLSGGIADPALQGRAQLDLLQDRLTRLNEVGPSSLLEGVQTDSVSNLRAHQLLAQHNTRQQASWPHELASWQEAARAFGQLGQALGMQRNP